MKLDRFLAVVLLSTVLIMLLGAAMAHAQRPALASIESYVIKSDDGSAVTSGPLMAGATYTVSFEVNVGVVPPDTRLSLYTPMGKAAGQDVYWHLENEYEGVDTELWQPGLAEIEFGAVEGVAQFTVTGQVPSGYTSDELSNGDYLHFLKSISLVTLSLGEELLDERPVSRSPL